MDKRRIYLEKEFREIITYRISMPTKGLVSSLEDICASVKSISGTNMIYDQGMEGDCVALLDPSALSVLLPNLHLFKNLKQLVLPQFVSRPFMNQWPDSLEEVTLKRGYDISGLCRLPKLRKVALLYEDVSLSPLYPIAQQIEELAFNSVADEQEIGIFQNLELLTYGGGTKAGSLCHFSSLTKLRRLFIEDFTCKTLDGLEACKALEALRIQVTKDGEYLQDISALSGLPALRQVAFLGDSLSDLSPLAKLPSLESLKLESSSVLDFSPLAEMKQLKGLTICHCLLDDLSVLEPLKDLEKLEFDAIHAIDYSPLLSLPKLQKVEVDFRVHLPEELCKKLGLDRPIPKARIQYNGFETRVENFDD